MTAMINLKSEIEVISNRYGYELYLESVINDGRADARIRFRIDSKLDTFYLKFSRSWKTTRIEFFPEAFASQVVNFLCREVISHKNELANILNNPETSISGYSLEIDNGSYEKVSTLDDSSHKMNFFVEAMTPESSIEHGLLNEKEAVLLNLAVSVIATLLPRPVNSYSSPDEVMGFPEGATTQVLVNKYERDPRNRAAAISVHGYCCLACGFDFKKIYGDLGNDFIIVHHVVPVSEIGSDYVIDPSKDLITLCANCHAMIHRYDPPLSLEELRIRVIQK
jgi:5-methylcytosine-specific restriction protein A